MTPHVEPAPAKINLALHVTGQRQDGFHTLHSLCVFTQLGDRLSIASAEADCLNVSGPFAADVPTGRANLVIRTLEKFRAGFPGAIVGGLAIHLEKLLPVAAGLGGGSADAAALLRLLARESAVAIPDAEVFALAAKLGADVPMCLASRTCEVMGIGEHIRPLEHFPPMHLVLVNPMVPVSTPEVFKRLERRENPPMPSLPQPLDRAAMLSLWLDDTRNDLQDAAIEIVPEIAPLLTGIAETQNCVLARMSGSGGTCFGLYGSEGAAHQAAHDLRERFARYWVSATQIL